MKKLNLAGLFFIALLGGVFLSDVLLIFVGVQHGSISPLTGIVQLDLIISIPVILIVIYCIRQLSKWSSVALVFLIFLRFFYGVSLYIGKLNDAVVLYAAKSEIVCGDFGGSGCSQYCGELVDFRSYFLTGRYDIVFSCSGAEKVEVSAFLYRGKISLIVAGGNSVERPLEIP